MKKVLSIAAVMAVLVVAAGVAVATVGDEWTGEVVEAGCYASQGAHGPDHVECAKRCFADGAMAGLLTADGELIALTADEEHAEVLDEIKSMPAAQVTVEGTLSEDEDGNKTVSVTSVTTADGN